MWLLEVHENFTKRLKKFQKKHRRELRNVLSNLETFHRALNAGARPQQIQRGFIHPEPKGVLGLDESGEGQHLKAIRLYIYPDLRTKTLHVIVIGDKASQSDDILLARAFVEGLLSQPVKSNQSDKESPIGDSAGEEE